MNNTIENRRKENSKTIECHVEERDITQMITCSESGMYDCSTRNAVAIAVSRTFGSNQPVKVNHWRHSNGFHCTIGEMTFKLPPEVSEWLGNVHKGIIGKPFSFNVTLPG